MATGAAGHASDGDFDRVVVVDAMPPGSNAGRIVTVDVTDDARGLREVPVRPVTAVVHGVQDPPVHRLEAVAHVRQRPRHDHAHGVIEVGLFHLIFEID